MKVGLVIPAAGSGDRLGRGMPKALVDVGGEPLLRRTLERLAAATIFSETLVMAPPGAIAPIEAAVRDLPASLGALRVLAGGNTRQESVALGVAALDAGVTIACVHDAARPLVDPLTVAQVIEAADSSGAATAASRPADSVRQENSTGGTVPIDRVKLWLVETPQAFRRELLQRAHEAAARDGRHYTDDASLVEALGESIRIVGSLGRNLKVTIETDLVLAAELLRRTDGKG